MTLEMKECVRAKEKHYHVHDHMELRQEEVNFYHLVKILYLDNINGTFLTAQSKGCHI